MIREAEGSCPKANLTARDLRDQGGIGVMASVPFLLGSMNRNLGEQNGTEVVDDEKRYGKSKPDKGSLPVGCPKEARRRGGHDREPKGGKLRPDIFRKGDHYCANFPLLKTCPRSSSTLPRASRAGWVPMAMRGTLI